MNNQIRFPRAKKKDDSPPKQHLLSPSDKKDKYLIPSSQSDIKDTPPRHYNSPLSDMKEENEIFKEV